MKGQDREQIAESNDYLNMTRLRSLLFLRTIALVPFPFVSLGTHSIADHSSQLLPPHADVDADDDVFLLSL